MSSQQTDNSIDSSMQRSGDTIVRPLTLKYVFALAMLAALAAGNFIILRTEILDGQGLTTVLVDAGRQRMLLDKTAILAERLVSSFDEAERMRVRDELLSDAHLLDKTHHELMSPATPHPIGVTDEVQTIYEDSPWLLDSEMRNYLLHLRSLANSEPEKMNYSNPHFLYIREPDTVEKIRRGLEAVVEVFQEKSNAKTRQLYLLAIWAFASTLLLLLLDGWFVFRPMVRQVRLDVVELNNLNETLEQRVAQRTAEATERAEQLAHSEAALRESEALYSSLLHHLPMSVLRKNCEGEFTFANEQFCALVGMRLDEIVGKTDNDFYTPQLAQKYRKDDRRVMETGCVFQDVEEYRTREGCELFVEVLKVPLRDASGALLGTQTMFWDVTDRKLAQQRAMQAERLAAIGQMVTGVAHESRNALQQIQACSQLLKWELDGDEKKQELIADLQRAEARLLRTFEELRSYAAPLKLERKPCDLRDVVAEAWSAIDWQRTGREVKFSEVGGEIPSKCLADPFQLETVFRNLFENAMTAGAGPVSIKVAYESVVDREHPPGIRITVSDNGPGLSPEQEDRIFEPFFTTKTHGTGLGMAIVKRIVDAHDGEIHAASTGEQGAAIVVTLPSGITPQPRQLHPRREEGIV